jgi:predicted nucleic acid-binding protein
MLLDTDFLIWCIRGNSNALVWLDEFEEIHLSAITYMELVQGTRTKKELAILNKTLKAWDAQILQTNEIISEWAAAFVTRYYHSHALMLADALIGSTALWHHVPLVTANIKHFQVIDGLEIIPFVP